MKHVAALCAAALALGTGPAVSAYDPVRLIKPRLQVNQISSTRFEVIESHGAGPTQYWCAAGYHALYVLGVQRGRVYIDTPRGPSVTEPGRKGVVFTVQPPENPVDSYTLSVNQAGKGLLIGAAIQHCRDHIIEPEDI